MIRLKNNYAINFDGFMWYLMMLTKREDYKGNEKEGRMIVSSHSTLESALQSYCNIHLGYLVDTVDMDLKGVREAINELKEELKAYE